VKQPASNSASTSAATIAPSPLFVRDGSAGLDHLSRTEWLLTNGLGGFAMGTASGVPTRRYHAWLVAALKPPVGRVVTLSGAIEQLVIHDDREPRRFEFSSYRFVGGHMHPKGAHVLEKFQKGLTALWKYRIGSIEVERELLLCRGDEPGQARNACLVRYRVRSGGVKVGLRLRPLVAMRDFHALHNPHHPPESAPPKMDVDAVPHGVDLRGPLAALHLRVDRSTFVSAPEPWRDFEYARDLDRGQDGHESIFSPGWIEVTPAPAADGWSEAVLRAWSDGPEPGTFEAELARVRARAADVVQRTFEEASAIGPGVPEADRPLVAELALAASQFIVHRESGPHGERSPAGVDPRGAAGLISVIAGYPWFSDWGRDTMISLPGLFLATGRHAEARRVLETFAAMEKDGLIPNCFDNGSGEAEYNTVDASLWFLHAACRYVEATGPEQKLDGVLRRTCIRIIEAYRRGTLFDIGVDPADGLVRAGSEGTQLTWMDAKRDGVVFTPRHGKPVEINALWYSGLLSVAGLLPDSDAATARALRDEAARVGESFRAQFWDDRRECLFDLMTPMETSSGPVGWRAAPELRPNQIFAASLPHSPLDQRQRWNVVRVVREHLLTPMGLRTLDRADPKYVGRFEGDLMSRDGAYHNGTVWPWLIGAYAEAVLRAGDFGLPARAEARSAIRHLLGYLDGPSSGQVAEIFDGDFAPHHPQRPDGCYFQAWSVAELLRVLTLLSRPDGK
jgi:glycogen debranching enzyme